MLWTSLRPCAGVLSFLLLWATAPAASAQAPSPAPAPVPPGPAAKQAPTAPKRAPAKSETAGGGGASGDAGLRQRVEQLEEQLVDMQVVIGTFESLAKGGVAAAPAAAARGPGGGFGAGEAARLDGLETQIRALTSQLEQLAEQVRALGGSPRKAELGPVRPNEVGEGFSARGEPAPGATAAIGAAPRFGSTTVTTDAGDPIGSLIAKGPSDGGAPGASGAGAGGGPAPGIVPGQSIATAPLPPVGGADGSAANPKQLYETAYAHLLQQDYAAAEAAFDDFLKRFPNDSLAGNAQYWLGESYFVRGQYKPAASAFLKGYQSYGKSAKAPDSLLKLAMSLDRLGQKEAACASFAELGTRFPSASANLKTRAQAERTRLGCT